MDQASRAGDGGRAHGMSLRQAWSVVDDDAAGYTVPAVARWVGRMVVCAGVNHKGNAVTVEHVLVPQQAL